MPDPLTYFLLILKASFLSSGGLANLPSIHQDFVERHWAQEGQFAEALLIGQLAPGPTGLWVVALGYLTYGFAGAALAVVAITLPPLLALPLDRVYRRLADQPVVQGLIAGLILAAAGSVMAVVVGVLHAYGFDVATAVILVLSVVLVGTRRLSRGALLVLSAAAGIAIYR